MLPVRILRRPSWIGNPLLSRFDLYRRAMLKAASALQNGREVGRMPQVDGRMTRSTTTVGRTTSATYWGRPAASCPATTRRGGGEVTRTLRRLRIREFPTQWSAVRITKPNLWSSPPPVSSGCLSYPTPVFPHGLFYSWGGSSQIFRGHDRLNFHSRVEGQKPRFGACRDFRSVLHVDDAACA